MRPPYLVMSKCSKPNCHAMVLVHKSVLAEGEEVLCAEHSGIIDPLSIDPELDDHDVMAVRYDDYDSVDPS